MTKEISHCKNLADFLKTEIEVIGHHLDMHKYFQHIEDDNSAIEDFNNKYGFLMREMYCHYICPVGAVCELATEYFKQNKYNQ